MRKLIATITLAALPGLALANSGAVNNAPQAQKNEPAYKLEMNYAEISSLLATDLNQNGTCSSIEASVEDIAVSLSNAKFYFTANEEWNSSQERTFEVPVAVSKALGKTLFLRDITEKIIPYSKGSVSKAIVGVTMWGPSKGTYQHISYYDFETSNSLVFAELDPTGNPGYVFSKGSYEVVIDPSVGTKIVITVNGETKNFLLKRENNIHQMWYMIPEDNPEGNPDQEGFVDYQGGCG